MLRRRIRLKHVLIAASVGALLLAAATFAAMRDVVPLFEKQRMASQGAHVTDRHGQPLAVTYQTEWNTTDSVFLHEMPPLLRAAFVVSEDKRFYDHAGVDWRARGSALLQNIRAGGTVRGASTLTEQVVRLLHPRPRTLWSKWVEGFDALLLERHTTKAKLLEFYLNQVPYAAHRRGVVQAARYYFNRDLGTLTPKEMLALAVLVRAPSGYDLYKDPHKIDAAIDRLAAKLQAQGVLPAQDRAAIAEQVFTLERPVLPVDASHFISFLRRQSHAGMHSTLDGALQAQVQHIVDDRVTALESKNLHNAAALVADIETGEVLAWVVAGAGADHTPAGKIDAVTVARQPGSSLKPFLYAAALDKGWTAATLIEDAPFAEAIGTGLHRFHNYSRVFYGYITLREALGNSLNIPALKTIRYVGVQDYLRKLHDLGFDSLARGADIYDEGLALGNGEVTLLELVTAYAALANGGVYRALRFDMAGEADISTRRVYSEAAASLTGHILSDPHARVLEFGRNSVLNMPWQTAAKTGTSTDYRDAWAVGYNDRYVVGIWMGNLDQKPTDGVTGGTGPALALRSIFAELNKNRVPLALRLSPSLTMRDICVPDAHDLSRCYNRSEWFMPGHAPARDIATVVQPKGFEIVKPTEGLQMAIDPRMPMDHQKLAFTLSGLQAGQRVEWLLNGKSLGAPQVKAEYLWPLHRGRHTLAAKVYEGDAEIYRSADISYLVK